MCYFLLKRISTPEPDRAKPHLPKPGTSSNKAIERCLKPSRTPFIGPFYKGKNSSQLVPGVASLVARKRNTCKQGFSQGVCAAPPFHNHRTPPKAHSTNMFSSMIGLSFARTRYVQHVTLSYAMETLTKPIEFL